MKFFAMHFILFVSVLILPIMSNRLYHAECGPSPATKFAELADIIGIMALFF